MIVINMEVELKAIQQAKISRISINFIRLSLGKTL